MFHLCLKMKIVRKNKNNLTLIALAALGRPSSTSSSNTPPSPSWSCLSSSLSRAFLSFRWNLGLKAYFPSRTSILGLLANAWRERGTKRLDFHFVCVCVCENVLLPLRRNIVCLLWLVNYGILWSKQIVICKEEE